MMNALIAMCVLLNQPKHMFCVWVRKKELLHIRARHDAEIDFSVWDVNAGTHSWVLYMCVQVRGTISIAVAGFVASARSRLQCVLIECGAVATTSNLPQHRSGKEKSHAVVSHRRVANNRKCPSKTTRVASVWLYTTLAVYEKLNIFLFFAKVLTSLACPECNGTTWQTKSIKQHDGAAKQIVFQAVKHW